MSQNNTTDTTDPKHHFTKQNVCRFADQILVRECAAHPFLVIFTLVTGVALSLIVGYYAPMMIKGEPNVLASMVYNICVFWAVLALFLSWLYRKIQMALKIDKSISQSILWRRIWPLRLFICCVFLLIVFS